MKYLIDTAVALVCVVAGMVWLVAWAYLAYGATEAFTDFVLGVP